jgi:cob(I)alamin adenosyltransferase
MQDGEPPGREALDPEIVKYLNRLSDAFFVWTRWAAQKQGTLEVLWDPNAVRQS